MPDLAKYFIFIRKNVEERRKVIKSFATKADAKRTVAEKFADVLTAKFGTVTFCY